MADSEQHRAPVDRLVDELVPEELDWEGLVCAYPLTSLAAATALGFLLGRRHGPEILTALTDWVGRYATRAVEEVLD